MADLKNFRGAINGFNREDVVRYIEYINNKHTNQVNQLKNELAGMQLEITAAREAPAKIATLTAQLEDATGRCTHLEAELGKVRAQLEEALTARKAVPEHSEEELEAYRRAERTERIARERAEQILSQANGALADASVRVDDAATRISEMASQVNGQLNAFRDAVIGTKAVLTDAATSLYAIRPADPE